MGGRVGGRVGSGHLNTIRGPPPHPSSGTKKEIRDHLALSGVLCHGVAAVTPPPAL